MLKLWDCLIILPFYVITMTRHGNIFVIKLSFRLFLSLAEINQSKINHHNINCFLSKAAAVKEEISALPGSFSQLFSTWRSECQFFFLSILITLAVHFDSFSPHERYFALKDFFHPERAAEIVRNFLTSSLSLLRMFFFSEHILFVGFVSASLLDFWAFKAAWMRSVTGEFTITAGLNHSLELFLLGNI